MWRWTVPAEQAPNEPDTILLDYAKGDPVALNGKRLGRAEMLRTLNKLGGKHGIGRTDIVENRYVGM